MSQEYDNELRGVLFKNDRKQNERHPDYKGSCEVDGVEYWLSAWIKEGKKGKFMSLSFQPKDEETEAPAPAPRQRPKDERYRAGMPAPAPQRGGFDDMDDDIPFVTASASFDMESRHARRMRRYA